MQEGEDLRQVPISDVAAVRAILINAAKELRATSYVEVLDARGHRFTRLKMRALCKTLDAISTAGSASPLIGSFWHFADRQLTRESEPGAKGESTDSLARSPRRGV